MATMSSTTTPPAIRARLSTACAWAGGVDGLRPWCPRLVCRLFLSLSVLLWLASRPLAGKLQFPAAPPLRSV